MTCNEPPAEELRRIRQACEELGADEEMTALVQASHCYNRTLLDVMLADGGHLLDYVRHKLAVWEAILTDSLEAPTALPCRDDQERTPGPPAPARALAATSGGPPIAPASESDPRLTFEDCNPHRRAGP